MRDDVAGGSDFVHRRGPAVTEPFIQRQALDAVMGTALSGMLVVSLARGVVVALNQAFTAVLGWSADEMVGRSTVEVPLYADAAERARGYDDLLRYGHISRREARIRHRRGDVRTCIITASVMNVDGERCLVGYYEDISTLRENEDQLRAMFDLAPIGLVEADLQTGRFRRVNRAFCRMLGYEAHELIRMTVSDVKHPEDRSSHGPDVSEMLRNAGRNASVKRYLRRDGRVIWVKVHVRAITGDARALTRTIATIEDITAQREIEETLHLQASALDAAANAIVITDAEGVVRWVNEAFSRLTGYSESEAIGRGMSLLRSGVHDSAFYAELWSAIRLGRTWRGEHVNRRKDGSLYPEFETITPVVNASGKITHYVAIKEDATERKRQEAALRREEERHRLALEAAGLGTFRHDAPDGRVLLDDRARLHFGVETGSVTVEELLARLHPDDVGLFRDALTSVHEPSRPARLALDLRVRSADAQTRRLSVHLSGHVADDTTGGALAFSVATTRDVTDARHAEEALRASEDRYRVLVDNLEEIVFSVDLEGRITFMNRAVERYGRKVEDLVGQPMAPFVAEEDLPRLSAHYAAIAAGAPSTPQEMGWRDVQGRVHQFRSQARPVFGPSGQLLGFTGLASDVTRQRETEEQLRAAQRMEAVGRLAGGVAHDFNNMLTVIRSYVGMALDGVPADSLLHGDLSEVDAAARRAEALTRQLLAFSRRQVFELEVVDLGELVAGLSKMLLRLIGEDVRLALDAGEPGLLSRVDRGQIEQVVMNLVVNARDAMPTGGALRIRCARAALDAARAGTLQLAAGEYVELSVSDDGVGMAPDVCARIFEPFFTTKGVGKGTGLGLSTVHGIVRQSGGGVGVDTAPGKGATFRVYLPAHRAEGDAPEPRRSEGAPTLARGHERILIVEDETSLRSVIDRALKREGYDVHVVDSGTAALAWIAEAGGKLDLVLTDVIMPSMNGRELAEVLGQSHPELKVAFMSGYTDDVLESYGVLGDRFLRKPFDGRTLATQVRRVLDEP